MQLNRVDFKVDRYILDRSLSLNWDSATQDWTPQPSLTTFDRFDTSGYEFVGNVTFATNLAYSDVNERTVSYINSLGGIDGFINTGQPVVSGDTLIFVKQEDFNGPPGSSYSTTDQAWQEYVVTYDEEAFDQTGTEFDPNRLVENDKFGIGPSNTTLFVVYRNNFTNDVNAAVGSLSQITSTTFNFADQANLDTNTINTVQGSLEVDNEVPIIGGFSVPTAEEIRIKALNHFASQNRAVTKEDYKSFVYALPAKFGSIARCNIVRDANSTKRNLNLYVLTEDNNSFLIQANNTIKQNLKTWLSRVKMINDTIDILDANVVNIGIRFVILATQQENKYVALTDGVNAVKEKFNRKFEIGEPIYITDVMTALQAVPTIADVKKVTILNRVGGVYSDINYNIDLNKSADGRYITIPEDHVFEIKYPNADIIGTVL